VVILVVLLCTFFFLGLVPFPSSPSRVRLCAVKYSMSEREQEDKRGEREERARRSEGTVRKKISVVAICTNVGGVIANFLLGLGSFSSLSLACALVCC
jgi:hypothetical protein